MTNPLEERMKSSLEESVQQLDVETLQRLQRIRHEALTQPKKHNWLALFQTHYWVPATGVVFCSLIAAMFFLPQLQNTNAIGLEQTAMFELLDSPEDIETLSDPAFYLWLDEQEAQRV